MNSWIKEGIFYQIYPLGFCGVLDQGKVYEEVNRIQKVEKWIKHLKEMNVKYYLFWTSI